MGFGGIDGFNFSIYQFSGRDDDAILICNMANDLIVALSNFAEELSHSAGDKPVQLQSLIYESIYKMVGKSIYNHQLKISQGDADFDDFIQPFTFSNFDPSMACALFNVENMIRFGSKYIGSYWLENLEFEKDDRFLVMIKNL
jgi:hypothetical protein